MAKQPRGAGPRLMPLTLAILAAAVTAGGCAVDQKKEVETYRAVVDLPPAPPLVHAAGEPLTLKQALRLANAHNESLSIEGETYLQAIIDRQRQAASLLPTLDLFGDYSFRDRGSGSSDGGGGGGARANSFDAGLSAQYTVFSGATNLNRVRAAAATIEQRRWLLLDFREALLLQAARAYYEVLLAERLASVFQSSVAVQEERLRDIRGRQQVGFARPLDVAQIEAQASETRVSLLGALSQVTIARAALAFLTGAEVGSGPLTDGFEVPSSAPSLDAFLALALSMRQDLAAAEAAARAARLDVDAEIGRYYPTVSLNLDYFLTRDTIPTDRDWTGLLAINLPLFSAGRIDADVRDAWSRFRQRVLDHSLVRRQIRRDIESTYEELGASGRRMQELEYQVRAASEALRQAEAAYQAGLGTNLERISAQDQLLSAEVNLTREAFNRKVAYLAVLRATGALAQGVIGLEFPSEPPPAPSEPPTSPFLNLPASQPTPAPET